MNSIPRVDQRGHRLSPITGSPPSLTDIPPGCSFHPRCPLARDVCSQEPPALREVAPGRRSACHFAEEVLGV
jgi:oligopeptide transport system ATP-binding protein